jgi:excinuclease ABC subunit C
VKAYQLSDELQRLLASLPDAPGVYFFKDAGGDTIYIGKALSLKSRVRSYWNTNSWRERPKLAVMMPRVESLDTIITNSEKEALLLEATLVRKHMPRYNVALKDDKRYPWLAITYGESFPRLIMVRDPVKFRKDKSKAKVFGPYVEAGVMWQTVRALRKVFPMRQRRKPLFKDRPCMNFHIGLCLGPCQKLVEESVYDKMVHQVELFLSGHQNEVVRELKKDMEDASERLDFEQAAKIRDRLYGLERIIERQQVFFDDQSINYDVVAEGHTDRLCCICLLRIREGKLVSSEAFHFPLIEKTGYQEAYQSFADQYYADCESVNIPSEVVIQHSLEDMDVLCDLLSSRAGRQVKVLVPQRGKKVSLMAMAQKNVAQSLDKQLLSQTQEDQKALATLVKLQEELKLNKPPRRIECFDISNIQGTDNVSSLVVFENAQPKRADYRHFKIKSVEGQADDFASMEETVHRRYRRVLDEDRAMPDLIIIDGGKGQLNAALSALSALGIEDQAIIGLAKKQEEVFLPNKREPILLPRRSESLFLLQRVRDEAHRFAVTFHRKLRAKRSILSELDKLSGVGAARRKILLDHFGSFDRIKAATLDELKSVPGIPAQLGQSIYNALSGEGKSDS